MGQLVATIPRKSFQVIYYFLQTRMAILIGFPIAQQVQVWAIQYQDMRQMNSPSKHFAGVAKSA